MYCAARIAAKRRGSNIRMRPATVPASSSANGTRVVLPAPGAADNTTQADLRTASHKADRTVSIGSDNFIQRRVLSQNTTLGVVLLIA
jgi:hypothetical protein